MRISTNFLYLLLIFVIYPMVGFADNIESIKTIDMPDAYLTQIRSLIEQNWSYKEILTDSQAKIRTIVNIRVLHNGKIEKIWLEEKSGIKEFDESVYRAVMKSDPLPPLPKGYGEYVFGFIFIHIPKLRKNSIVEKRLQNALDRLKDKSRRMETLKGGVGDVPDYYAAQLRYQIEKNWSYPESLAGTQAKVQAIVNIRVSSNGEIKEVWFERRSGNKYLDESAHKAVMKSDPLPPPPKGYSEYVFGFIFTPKGLK